MEIPILFSTPMVQAILDGRKTMTRRVVKHNISYEANKPGRTDLGAFGILDKNGNYVERAEGEPASLLDGFCPYGNPGDVLEIASYIEGYPKDYCAGYNGTIYSRARTGEWKPLRTFAGGKGYLSVTIMINGKKTTRNVHTLVCTAFHGKPHVATTQVRHLDGFRGNNNAANLKWGTQEENWQDRKAHGNGIEGEKHPMSILTDEERGHLKWALQKGLCSQRHAASILNISQSTFSNIVNPGRLITPTEEPIPNSSPLWLEVVSVRVERLQVISRGDAMSEGCPFPNMAKEANPIDWFSDLWTKINGLDSWEANPWVWVVEFKRIITPNKFNVKKGNDELRKNIFIRQEKK